MVPDPLRRFRPSELGLAAPRRVLLLSGAHAMNEFFGVALPPILPLLVADFPINYAEAGFLLTVFFAVYSVFQIPAGVLADRVGKPPLVALSVGGLAAGVLLASTAGSYVDLVVAQTVAGASGSAYHPSGMALISDVESDESHGRAMGIHGFGGVAGVALAPVLIGSVSDTATWRTALVAASLVGFAFTAAFVLVYPWRSGGDDGADDGSRGPETDGGSRGPETDGGKRRPAVGDALATVRRRLGSLSDVMFSRLFLSLFAVHVLVSAEVRATHSFTTAYAYEQAASSATRANVVFFVLLVGSAIASLLSGRLADAVDRRKLGVAAALATAPLFGLTWLVPSSLVVLSGWFFLIGLVMYVQAPAMNAITAEYTDADSSGALFGLMTTAGALGSAAAPTLFGVLSTRFDTGTAFAAIGVVCVVAAVAFYGASASASS
jgi:FSR family fosmidomycin resistance protein-like MFS transporter